MRKFTGLVTVLSRWLDIAAGFCIVAVMGLVVTNILFRVLLNRPIFGAYEYVGFLTAAAIGLALAYCAVQNGHIAVGFFVERFPLKLQAVIDSFVNIIALCFWSLTAWYIGKYAGSMAANGLVSSTTQIPFYHFVYLIAFSLLVLCLVLVVKTAELRKKAKLTDESA